MEALNEIKSFLFAFIKSMVSSVVCAFANESGSSPFGNKITFTFIPSSRIKSMPRNEALIPAASPSKRIVIFFVYLEINFICSFVKEVPEDETTF